MFYKESRLVEVIKNRIPYRQFIVEGDGYDDLTTEALVNLAKVSAIINPNDKERVNKELGSQIKNKKKDTLGFDCLEFGSGPESFCIIGVVAKQNDKVVARMPLGICYEKITAKNEEGVTRTFSYFYYSQEVDDEINSEEDMNKKLDIELKTVLISADHKLPYFLADDERVKPKHKQWVFWANYLESAYVYDNESKTVTDEDGDVVPGFEKDLDIFRFLCESLTISQSKFVDLFLRIDEDEQEAMHELESEFMIWLTKEGLKASDFGFIVQ